MNLLKDIRFVSLIVLAFAAVALIAAPTFLKSNQVTVNFVDPTNKCSVAVKEGDVINQVYADAITDIASFNKAMSGVKSGDRVTMVINGLGVGCNAIADKSIGIEVQENKPQSLNFGIDIQGGTRVILSPAAPITTDQLSETVKTLENRINFYGLKEVKVNTLGNNLIQMEMAGATGDDIRNFLAKQGKFAAKLAEDVSLAGGGGKLRYGNSTYDLKVTGGSVIFQNRSYSVNDTFLIQNQSFQVISLANNSVLVYADLFTGEDIVNVLTDSQNSQITQLGTNSYQFSFGIQVSRQGADRFAKLTQDQPVVSVVGTDKYIEPKMVLFLDEKEITSLNIASSLAGQQVTSAVINGGGTSLDDASTEKLRLESTLRSGSLPVKLEIAKVDTITQTAGKDLINSTIFVALASIIAVSAIVSYRYRDYKVVIPMIIISLLEIVIVIGMAASQIFAGAVIVVAVLVGLLKREITGIIGWITLLVMIMAAAIVVISPWTLDIPAIAGLIAILGTGVNQMIIMTDQLFKEKGKPLPERHKAAMHIIWSSAAIVVFAMIPLILGGIGSLKGFAIATIVGVLVGLLVTRPAYVAIVERVKKVQLESM